MDTLFGLPAHPLLVHIPVVLVPLTAVAIIAMAMHRPTMEKLRWIVLGLATVATAATLIAAEAGEALEHSVEESKLLETHTEAGDQFKIIMLVFFLVVAAFLLVDYFRSKNSAAGSANGTVVRASGNDPLSIGLRVLAVVAAVGATWFVVDVGHSGAQASWDDVKVKSGQEVGETDDGD
jgi:uncharacterized membrane protein